MATSTTPTAPAPASARQHLALAFLLAALPSIGPFAIDAYLPALQEIATEFDVSIAVVQQTLTAYILPFALMTLWHGAISDSFGRKNIILIMMALFAGGTLCCAFSWNIESMLFFRALQGITAGAGMVVGRAVVRDLLEGAEAQRLMGMVAITFALAPAVAPVIGGWLHVWFGWRSIFIFLAILSAGIWAWAWRAMPETLPRERRQPFKPGQLFSGFVNVLRSGPFLALGFALAFGFSGIFLYIVSAPVFLMQHIGVSETAFLWLFGPMTAGMMLGVFLSNRMAGKYSARQTILRAYSICVVAAVGNLVFHYLHSPALPWSVVPLFIYTIGSSMAMPSLTLVALDLFPERRGMASSCQSFLQSMGNVIVSGAVAPLLWRSTVTMALGQVGLAVGALGSFMLFLSLSRRAAVRAEGGGKRV